MLCGLPESRSAKIASEGSITPSIPTIFPLPGGYNRNVDTAATEVVVSWTANPDDGITFTCSRCGWSTRVHSHETTISADAHEAQARVRRHISDAHRVH